MIDLFRQVWLGFRFFRSVRNWRACRRAYQLRQPLPPVRLRSGLQLEHGPEDAPALMVFEIFQDGAYRRRLPCRPDGAVLDIGANIGAVTLDLAHRFPALSFHAYEPAPGTRLRLENNIRINGFADRVVIHPEAVGARPGVLDLWTDGPSVAVTAYGSPRRGTPVRVSVTDLETCLRRIGDLPIALLKIDAEGAEVEILEHAELASIGRVATAAIEYHADLVPRADERCLGVLRAAGFACEQRASPTPGRGMIWAWRPAR